MAEGQQAEGHRSKPMSPGTVQGLMRAATFVDKLKRGDSRLPTSEESPTIKVCVRVRPFITEEISGERSGGKCEVCIKMPSKTRVEITGREEEQRHFDFDRCFWSHSEDHELYATQETLQEELGKTLLEHAMNGFNNCIFAYGQTGSGKSFSVLGGRGDERGLLPRVVEGLYEKFKELPAGTTVKTLVSFIEIYNEEICDLLAAPEDQDHGHQPKKKLEVRHHPTLGTIMPGLTEAAVSTSQEVLKLVEVGASMRHTSATKMNKCSSRSHCIFTFKTSVHSADKTQMSQTHLVDLAGSERAGRTKATGDRLKEGAAINQSLSTLARVISELAKKKKAMNPPFRESKLTWVLKESLCGNSKTVMMAAISPSLADYDETLSTMKFAQSVKQVQTKAVANSVNEGDIESQLRNELEQLKAELKRTQEEARHEDPEQSQVIEKRLQEQEELCRYYGKDWDSLLKEEQDRMRKRSSIKVLSLTAVQLEELQAKASGASLDGMSEISSDDESESATWECTCPIVHLDEESEDEEMMFKPSMRHQAQPQDRNTVFMNGPLSKSMKSEGGREKAEQRAKERAKELGRCRADATAAEKLVERLAGSEVLKLHLSPMVCVLTEEHPIQSKIFVYCTRHRGIEGLPPLEEEVITPQELQARLGRLIKAGRLADIAARSSSAPAVPSHDAWAATAAAEPELAAAQQAVSDMESEMVALRKEVEGLRQRLAASEWRPTCSDQACQAAELEMDSRREAAELRIRSLLSPPIIEAPDDLAGDRSAEQSPPTIEAQDDFAGDDSARAKADHLVRLITESFDSMLHTVDSVHSDISCNAGLR